MKRIIKKFKGCGVAVITPFNRYGNVDFKSLGKIIDHLIESGVNYLVILGTTAESVTLNSDERNAIIEFARQSIGKRVPLVVGFGGNNTQDVMTCIQKTNCKGIDAILSVSPYYNKPQQKGIIMHYKAIAGATSLPIIAYNVPGRTGSNMTAETTLEIASTIENVIAIKEASGNLSQTMRIIDNKPDDFLVISGDDALTLPMMAAGADGVISVVANAFPSEFLQMVSLCLKGDYDKARVLHYRLFKLIEAIFAEGSPSGVKAAMEVLEMCNNNLRLPLVKVSKQHHNYISELVRNISSVK